MGSVLSPAEIEKRFHYHQPISTRAGLHKQVRRAVRQCAESLNEVLGDFGATGREAALVFTHLEEAMFWGNAAVARQDHTVLELFSAETPTRRAK